MRPDVCLINLSFFSFPDGFTDFDEDDDDVFESEPSTDVHLPTSPKKRKIQSVGMSPGKKTVNFVSFMVQVTK